MTESRAARVERLWVQNTVPARFFDAKSSLKILLMTLLTLKWAISMFEMLIVTLTPVVHEAAVPVIQ